MNQKDLSWKPLTPATWGDFERLGFRIAARRSETHPVVRRAL